MAPWNGPNQLLLNDCAEKTERLYIILIPTVWQISRYKTGFEPELVCSTCGKNRPLSNLIGLSTTGKYRRY